MPFKTFIAGETATAADINTYLAKQVVIVCTSGTRPGSPVEGMVIYETDTDKCLTYDGATWNLPKNVAGGTLGYAEAVANQTGITAAVDLTSLSVAVTVGAGRRIRVTGFTRPFAATVTTDAVEMMINEGATLLQSIPTRFSETARPEGLMGAVILTPSVGSHTYKLQMRRYAGTGTISNEAAANAPSFIHVEDVGGA